MLTMTMCQSMFELAALADSWTPPSEFGSEQEVISETVDGDSITTVPTTTKKPEASKEGTLELDKAQLDD